MNTQGKVVAISQTIQVSDSFKKRDFVLEIAENPQYPQFVKFDLIQDKCELFDKIKVGQTIDVQFNLNGRKWTDPNGEDKYFNSLQAWKVIASGTPSNTTSDPAADYGKDNDDDLNTLPF
jgi:hypothetical protein